ncbi:DNA gyrase subunit B [Myxococcus sp. K38C18041901]|uniref:DNA gyrase subunit B n=1 Tax=Myxococcus guangdongensis TaxID=2906760 RepID=UPI0020A836F4|nr:DNA gyrase subunit B [Myxococcus guangdongensis]MCP3062875.1 DNA gyrase subunit B [Myxococcus guangdongensis]
MIRRRPGMYVGGLDAFGLGMFLEHLLVLGFNAGRLGRVRNVCVDLLADGACRLSLDGSPWPLPPWTAPLASLEPWLTVDAFASKSVLVPVAPGIPSGIHCRDSEVYLGAINVLSSRFDVVAWSKGQTWRRRYREGRAEEDVLPLSVSDISESGLCITATPDDSLFESPCRFSWRWLQERVQALSAFHAGVSWTLRDESTGTEARFLREHGLADLCAELADTSFIREPWTFEGQVEAVWLRVALGWRHRPSRGLSSWVNLQRCLVGGPHHRGFLVGMRRAFVSRLRRLGRERDAQTFSDGALLEHLTGVLDLRVAPDILGNPHKRVFAPSEVEAPVARLAEDWVTRALTEDPELEATLFKFAGCEPAGGNGA